MSAVRPPQVPADAWFAPDEGAWVLGERDAQGRRSGHHKTFRSDGTPWLLGTYRDGAPHGPFARFHPNGELARVGHFVEGRLHGLVEGFASDAATQEGLRTCCVPSGAHRVEAEYVDDALSEERFYDRASRRLLSDGSLYPARPENVPSAAIFEEGARWWALGAYTDQGERNGLWRRWSEPGVLREALHFQGGKLHGMARFFDEAGELVEMAMHAGGVYDGAYFRRVPEGYYADSRIAAVEGSCAEGRAVALWRFLDDQEKPIEHREFAPLPPLLVGSNALCSQREAESAGGWPALAERLSSERRVGESILAAARAAVARGDKTLLLAYLARAMPALAPAHAHELAASTIARAGASASADAALRDVVDALQRGGEPASLLRHLASSLVPVSTAARDLVDAALLLAPERREFFICRALVNLAIGDPEAAEQDVLQLDEASLEAKEFLSNYRRVLYPTFDFWPTRAPFDSQLTGVPDAPQRTLASVQCTIQKYATRLALIRRAVLVHTDGSAPSWAPPDVSQLLPEGPVALEQRRVFMTDDDDDSAALAGDDDSAALAGDDDSAALAGDDDSAAVAGVEVVIDETLDLAGRDVAALMRLARAEWNGLTWCCYAAGLGEVALPDQVNAPADFAQAVGMAAERHWRARDRLSTAGLRAATRGVRGFTWEGLDIDAMPTFFAEMAANEYTELRALLVFLCDEQAESPWQDDLRRD